MDPYRSPAAPPRPTHRFGSVRARRLRVLGALAAIGISVLLFLRSTRSDDAPVGVYVFMPALFGILLLQQARTGSVELRPEERAGVVTLRRLWPTQRTRFAYADVVRTCVGRVSFFGRPADFELGLELSGGRIIPLLRASREPELRAAQRELDAFLADNDLPPERPGAA